MSHKQLFNYLKYNILVYVQPETAQFQKIFTQTKTEQQKFGSKLVRTRPISEFELTQGSLFQTQSTVYNDVHRATLTKPKLATLPKPKIITNKKMRTHFLLCLVTISGNFDSICYLHEVTMQCKNQEITFYSFAILKIVTN